MRHPSEGTLRRLVDEPVAVPDPDRTHVAACATCLAGLAAARDDARATAAVLPADTGAVDVDRAWAGLTRALPGSAVALRRDRPARPGRVRAALRRPAAAALGAVVVLGGAGVAAANDWLPVFRAEQVAAVELRPADLVAVPDLTAYGDLEITAAPQPASVPDAATAEQRTGLAVPTVDELPVGVTGEPGYQVVERASGTFTFDPVAAADATGGSLPPVPEGLAGSSFRIDAGPGVAAIWTQDSGAPSLVVARAQAPTVFSDGVPFETARDYLLSLPGLPPALAEQLRAVSEDGRTLPLPVPADFVEATSAEVGGSPATVLTSRDGLVAGVVWVSDGVVTVVGGTVSAEEALDVARGLR